MTKHELKFKVGDHVKIDDQELVIASEPLVREISPNSGMYEILFHAREKDFGNVKPEDLRGSKEFQESMQNDHTSPPGSTDPFEGTRKQMEGKKQVFVTQEDFKKSTKKGE